MKSIEEIADEYIREQYIDYGDLNDRAEKQIRDAVIFGLTQEQKFTIEEIINYIMSQDSLEDKCIRCHERKNVLNRL
mgnify:CR=1 FL=1|tara:strand:- start:508 stop:738 length:231 start_codon:yes stop_codon:yes gene_type:complete